MIAFCIATLMVTLGFALVLRGYYLRTLPQKAHSYRRRYQQLMSRIELGVLKLNTLGNLVPHVKNNKVLDEFESCLRMMETLLGTLVRLPQFAFKDEMVGQVQPLVSKTEEKIELIYRKFKDSIEERPLFAPLLEKWKEETSVPVQGCYFCSRPYMKAYFKPASIRIDGIKLRVFGCHICVAELKSTKKVRVLYFLESGQPLHWALLPDYRPSEQFWNLNRRRSLYQSPEIEWLSES
jgi:hypothetical protein